VKIPLGCPIFSSALAIWLAVVFRPRKFRVHGANADRRVADDNWLLGRPTVPPNEAQNAF
jgi:hypothetical protein